MRFLPLLALLLAGCPHARPDAPAASASTCLDLPGTSRASLRLSADGKQLFWYELVPYYGYDDTWSRPRIVAWDLGGAAAPHALTDIVGAPYRVLDDGVLVGVNDGGLVVWRDGIAELVSNHDTIDHLEVLGDNRTVVYAAAGAIWQQPLHRTSSRLITDADELVGVDGDAIIVWRSGRSGQTLVRREVTSGTERTLPTPDGELVKTVGRTMIVRQSGGIALQPMAGGPARRVLEGEWHTYLAPDGIKAWRAEGHHIDAAIVTDAGAEQLPGVDGADALVGFVRLPDKRIAYLVGHDIDGDDEVTTTDEDDVCIGAADKPLAITPRAAPKRFAAAVPAFEALATSLGTPHWRVNGTGETPGVTFSGGSRRDDRARRWADVGRAAGAVTEAVGDPTFDVAIEYEDGGRALAEWDASTGKRVRWAGVGGALVPDPSAYDVEISTETLVRADDGTVTCAGTVTNHTDRVLEDLAVDCVGGTTDKAIPVFPTSLRPGATGHFTGTTASDHDGALLATVHRPSTGESFLTYEPARAARYERIAAAAAEVVDRARLTVWDWSGGAEVGVVLWGPTDFGDYSDAARESAAEIAYDVLKRVDRAAFLGEANSALALTIRSGSDVWTFDGKELVLSSR